MNTGASTSSVRVGALLVLLLSASALASYEPLALRKLEYEAASERHRRDERAERALHMGRKEETRSPGAGLR